MLSRVLLHVLEAAIPVDPPVRRARQHLAFDDVQHHSVITIDDVHHARVTEGAGIEGLTTRRRIEGRAVENGGCATLRVADHVEDRGVEFLQVGVGVVEAIGHRITGSATPASAKPAARRRQLSHRPQTVPSGAGS